MDRERIDAWCEKGMLAFLLGILIFGPLATGAVRPMEFLVLQALTLAVTGLWIARLWLNPEARVLWPPLTWAVLAFVGYAAYRHQTAPVEYLARAELIRVVVYTLLFFAVLCNLHRQESVQAMVLTLVFLAMAISLYAGYQLLTGSDRVWHFIRPDQYEKRGSGTYICPNHLAGFLEMVLPLGLAYTIASRIGPVLRIMLAYASVVILAGIGFSISRGGWIATGLSLLVFFAILVRQRQYRWPALIAFVLLLGAGGFFVSKAGYSHQRFREMFVAGKLENVRFRLWKPAVEIWRQSPWLGAGPGHFDARFRAYRPEDVQMRPNRTHNDYLNTLADWGMVGFALVGAIWAMAGWGVARCWKYVHRSQDLAVRRSNRSAFVLGASIGLLAILLHSAVDFNMHIPANAILAIVLMGLLATHWRFATERFWWRPGLLGRLALTAALLAGGAFLVRQGVRGAAEYAHLARAEEAAAALKPLTKQLQSGEPNDPALAAKRQTYNELDRRQVEELKAAFAAEPRNPETVYRIGEALRVRSWQGEKGYESLAEEAMTWFSKGMILNPFDAYNPLRFGMCLHWLGRHAEAAPYFEQARLADPNGYYTVAHIGWHHVELGDFAEAKRWFERSLRLKPHRKDDDNPIAASYLRIVERRQREALPPRPER